MRIAIVGARNFPAKHGGLEVAVENLARQFAAAGNEVHVFTEKGSATVQGITTHESRAVRTKHLHTATQVLGSVKSVRALKADIVHVHGVGPSFPLLAGARAFGAPAVVTSHGVDWERSKWSPGAARAFRVISIRSLRRAGELSAVSKTTGATIGRSIGREITVIPNGVSTTSISRRQPPASRYVVSASRITPEKRVDWLVKHYDRALAQEHGPLVVVGSGGSSHSSTYEREVMAAAGPDVIFLGALSHGDTLSVVAGASAFLSASELEAQPLAVMEAMALGVPTCLSDIEPHSELVGDAGSYFKLTDPGSFRVALRDAINVDALRKSRVKQLADSLTWEHSAERYLEMFARLTQRDDATDV